MRISNGLYSLHTVLLCFVLLSCSEHSPLTDAGEDQSVEVNQVVELTGQSWDPDGDIESQGWTQILGAEVDLIVINETSVSFVAPISLNSQILQFTFDAVDSDGSTYKDPVYVFVEPLQVIKDVGDDQRVSYKQNVELQGVTTDFNEFIVDANWEQTSGPEVEVVEISNTEISFVAPITNEVITFTFNVIDSSGKETQDSVNIQAQGYSLLNDTGVTLCADYAMTATGSGNESNAVDCSLSFDEDSDIVPAMQDGHVGFDVSSQGIQGFDFTKIDQNGLELLNDATDFNCVKDNRTGLIWEGKQVDGGLHDISNRFNWYETDPTINAGDEGFADNDGDICWGYDALDSDTFCNTQAFVNRVNAHGLCGLTQWRLPTKRELVSLIDYSRTAPAIDLDFFPNTDTFAFWSINNHVGEGKQDRAWYVYFNDGSSSNTSKDGNNNIRLVHDVATQ